LHVGVYRNQRQPRRSRVLRPTTRRRRHPPPRPTRPRQPTRRHPARLPPPNALRREHRLEPPPTDRRLTLTNVGCLGRAPHRRGGAGPARTAPGFLVSGHLPRNVAKLGNFFRG